MIINTETHNWTMYIELDLGVLLKGISSSEPLPKVLGICAEEEAERLKESEVEDNSKERASSSHNSTDAHTNSQRL